MTVHFSERHVADQICIGLSDVDIRQALMTDPIKKKTVDQTLIFVEAREEARRCAPQLTTTPDDLDAVHSSYRRSKRPAQGERPSLHSPPNRQPTPAHTAVGRATVATPQPESVVTIVLHSTETARTVERRTTWPRSAGAS